MALALAQAAAPAAPATPAPAAEPRPFLHGLPVRTSLSGPLAWREVTAVITPRAAGGPRPAFVTRRHLQPRQGRYLVTRLDEVASADPVLPRHLRPSWVIDLDQPSFRPAVEAARAQLGPAPTAAALTAFTAAYLTTKDFARGFDLASRVATTREGDCTEHAVFLAGLLRSFGIPARGILGVVLVPGAGPPRAFGHMWVEARVGGRWVVADAAVPEGAGAAYLPAGELEDEGPGYRTGLMRALMTLDFEALELLAADAR